MKTKKIYRLAVGPDGPSGHFASLTRVYHVSHLVTAMRILEDGRIAARQIDDDSCLDDHRVSVSWLSPNQWDDRGSHYGTAQFEFDFAELVAGKRMYWVEGITDRSHPTCRMLITDRDVSDLPVTRYRPKTSEGPIRLVDGEWFWRDDLTLELLFDGDLPLSRCVGLTAVPHHRDHCIRGSAHNCKELRRSTKETGARILAGALARRYRLPAATLVANGEPSLFFRLGRKGLIEALDARKGDFGGKLRRRRDVDPNVRAASLQVSIGDENGASDTISAVASAKRVRSSLKRMLKAITDHAATQLRLSARAVAERDPARDR